VCSSDLRNGQILIGDGASGDFATLAGITPAPFGNFLPTLGNSYPILVNSTGEGITLGTNNTIYGVTVGNTSGAAIAGTNFGTLLARDVAIEGTGRLLDLSNGMLDATFDSLVSTDSSGGAGISLSQLTDGSRIEVTSDIEITNAATHGIAIDAASGADITVEMSSNITVTEAAQEGIHIGQTGANSILNFGTVTIANRNSTGILIDGANGTIHFTDATIDNPNGAAGYGIWVGHSAADLTFDSVNISDTQASTPQTEDGNGNPSNEGDGDGILLLQHSGNFTVNGGLMERIAGDGIDVRSLTGDLDIQALSIYDALGDGIQLIDPANPTATMEFDSIIIGGIADGRSGIEWRGTTNGAANLYLRSPNFLGDGGSISDKGISITPQGSAYDASLVVDDTGMFGDPARFSTLEGGAIAISAGENGGSGTISATITKADLSSNGIIFTADGTSTIIADLAENTITTTGAAVTFNQPGASSQFILPGYTGASNGDLSADIATYLEEPTGQNNDLTAATTKVEAQTMINVTNS